MFNNSILNSRALSIQQPNLTRMKFSLKKKVTILSLLIYIISLTQVAFCTGHCIYSYSTVLVGWMGLIIGGANFAWLVNPLLAFLWFYPIKNNRILFSINVLALILALLPLFIREIAVDEAGTPRYINSFGPGYWLWILSIVVLLVGHPLNHLLKEKRILNELDPPKPKITNF